MPSARRSNSRPRDAPVALHHAPARREAVGDRLPDVGEVPPGHRCPPSSDGPARSYGCRPVDFELPADDDPRRDGGARPGWPSTPSRPGRELAEAGYVAPHWPRPWGLDADPIHQLIIDDELARAGVSPPVEPDRHRLGRPDDHPRRHRGAEGALPVPAARRRGDLVPAVQRARRRQRPGRPRHPRRARRRRVRRERPEDLDLVRRHTVRSSASSSPAPIPTRPSTRASPTSSARWTCPASRSARSSR